MNKNFYSIILVLLTTFVLSGCIASRPVLNAFVDPDKKSEYAFGANPIVVKDNISQDSFPVNRPPFDPASITYSRIVNDRFEWGFGLSGLYQKLAFVPSEDYEELDVDNLAITQFSNVYGLLWGEYGEIVVDGGFLVGIPFNKVFSVTSGICCRYLSSSDKFSTDSTGNRINYVYTATNMYFPISLIAGNKNHKIACGFEFPIELKENYYKNGNPLQYDNHTNFALRVSYCYLR